MLFDKDYYPYSGFICVKENTARSRKKIDKREEIMRPSTRLVRLALVAAAVHGLAGVAIAQTYPSKPIRWMLGFWVGQVAVTIGAILAARQLLR